MDFFSLFPAHAGVIHFKLRRVHENLTFPRTRGGDPESVVDTLMDLAFSPHTRG